jgi:hypothetical protein
MLVDSLEPSALLSSNHEASDSEFFHLTPVCVYFTDRRSGIFSNWQHQVFPSYAVLSVTMSGFLFDIGIPFVRQRW